MRKLIRMGRGVGNGVRSVTRLPGRLARKPAAPVVFARAALPHSPRLGRTQVKVAALVLVLVAAGTVLAVLWRRIGRMTVVEPSYPTPERQSGYSGSSNSLGTPAASASALQGTQSDLVVALAQFADAATEYLSSIRAYYQHTERAPQAVGSELLTGINASSDRFVRANGRLLAARTAAGAAFQNSIDDFMVRVNTVVDEEADTPPHSERPERRVREALTTAIERVQAISAKGASAS